jgi:hypothetical protein
VIPKLRNLSFPFVMNMPNCYFRNFKIHIVENDPLIV